MKLTDLSKVDDEIDYLLTKFLKDRGCEQVVLTDPAVVNKLQGAKRDVKASHDANMALIESAIAGKPEFKKCGWVVRKYESFKVSGSPPPRIPAPSAAPRPNEFFCPELGDFTDGINNNNE